MVDSGGMHEKSEAELAIIDRIKEVSETREKFTSNDA